MNDKIIRELISLRRFFENNVTGFTYLFFAQASFLAENIFWRYQLKGAMGHTSIYSLTGWLVLIEILFYYSLPLLFVIAAFLTFKYPNSKTDRVTFVFITVALTIIVLTATLVS